MKNRLFMILVLMLGGLVWPDTPDSTDRAALIARMREAAVSYSDRLENFICTQITRRTDDKSGSGKHWQLLEIQELEVSYVAHNEHYVLLKVNGDSKDPEAHVKKGYFTAGREFGTGLKLIFTPMASAEFAWDHEEQDNARRLCIFRYSVPLTTSTLVIQVNSERVTLAHHGLVYADCETGSILRFQIETDPATAPKQRRAVGLQLDVRYRPTMIGTKEFLLPYSAEEIAPYGKTLTKAEIQFLHYRKFEANSKILFDSEDNKPKKVPEVPR